MKRGRRMTIVAVAVAALVMLVGAGYAFAQSDNTGTTPAAPNSGTDGGQSPGPECGRGRGPLMGGDVVKVDGDLITINTVKQGEKTVKVNDQTKYRKDGNDATKDDVKAGEKIGVLIDRNTINDENPLAKAVMIGEPPAGPRGLKERAEVGTVKSLEGDTLTITTPDGDKQVKLPTISAGQRIAVVPGADGSAKVVVYDPPEKPQGQEAPPAEAPAPEGNNA